MPEATQDARYPSHGGQTTVLRTALNLAGHFRYATGRPGSSGFGSSSTAEQVAAGWSGDGRVVVITGANTGLGEETMRVLAGHGATVIALVRNPTTMEQAVGRVRNATPHADIRVIRCELDNLESVAAAAQAVLATGLPLHTLILNAGVMAPPFQTTKQGLELQIGVNHVAHALLVRFLLPCLVATASETGAPQGRVVCLSSVGHLLAPRHGLRSLTRINSPEGYDKWLAYGQSKLANILFARELARWLLAAGINNVAAVSCHPGVIPGTSLFRHTPFGKQLMIGLSKTVPQGAATQVFLATAPGLLPSGEYYADCNAAPSSALAHDATLGKKLWAWTEEQLKGFVDESAAAKQPIAWA